MFGSGENVKSMAYVKNVAAFINHSLSFDQGLLNCVDWYKRFVKLYYDEKSFFKHLL